MNDWRLKDVIITVISLSHRDGVVKHPVAALSLNHRDEQKGPFF